MRVLIGGFYDILHSGHIFALLMAKSYGDYLIVNVSPDERARMKKGEGRPILPLEERMFIVNNLRVVDEVVSVSCDEELSEDDYQTKYVGTVMPDIFIGKVYSKKVAGFCKEMGIRYQIVREIPGITKLHSTDFISKLKKL
jgi:cytidyltransferase-like protein